MDGRVSAPSAVPISPDDIRATLRAYFSADPAADRFTGPRAEGVDEKCWDRAGFDPECWKLLAGRIGLAGLGAPRRSGGMGLGLTHLVAAVEECAASAYPGPVRATVLMAHLLAVAGATEMSRPVAEVVAAAVAGEAVIGAPIQVGGPRAGFADGLVGGRLGAMTHGPVADAVLAELDAPGGPALGLVVLDSAVTQRFPIRGVDGATPLAYVEVSGAPAVLLGAAGDQTVMHHHRAAAALLLAAEQVGGVTACLRAMVECAGLGGESAAPAGPTRAVSHRCSETAVIGAAARALVHAAAGHLDRPDPDRPAAGYLLALLARAEAADGYIAASSALVQICDGTGAAREHEARLHFRRARAVAALGATPDRLRDKAVAGGCLDLLRSA
ncbi:acyl-CoA dehydrogenase family protein [Gordonia desulfuricans]|uniref:Acyl-CoA dehydrogenase family protein n=1 Tax=Gordonia desulfuricans TaxID=89051 RepID=A0A7K3LPN9_9ACTN|nr:acyl-CoA dehydrogenase family protein [Gordonia desulfuricans]